MRDPRGNLSLVGLVGAGLISLILFAVNTMAVIPTLIGSVAILAASSHVPPNLPTLQVDWLNRFGR